MLCTNPLVEYLNELPESAGKHTYSPVCSDSTDGRHDKDTTLVIVEGPDTIDEINIPGVRKLRGFHALSILRDVLTAEEISELRGYFEQNTDLDVSDISDTQTYIDAIKTVAVKIQPRHKGFGDKENRPEDWR